MRSMNILMSRLYTGTLANNPNGHCDSVIGGDDCTVRDSIPNLEGKETWVFTRVYVLRCTMT